MPSSLLAQPHHDGGALHVANDAPVPGETVPVFVRVPNNDGLDGVWVRTTPNAEPHFVAGRVDRTTASETWWRCDIKIHNPLTGYRFLLGGGPRGYRWLNGTGIHTHDITDAADFRLSTAAPPPSWACDAVVYQVFPDRFARSPAADERRLPAWAQPAGWDDPVVSRGPATPLQLYGGDLDGIVERLDHLADLGVNALYLTPFFPGASNHRYNAASFAEVDPLLGGDKALARLSQAVHARGWHLLGDLTTNHCGDTHPWFPPGAGGRRFAGAGVLLLPRPPGQPVRKLARALQPAEVPLLLGRAAPPAAGRPRLDRRALAAAPLRPGRLAGRRGQHDRPPRRRRLQRRGGPRPAGDHGRGPAWVAAAGRALSRRLPGSGR